jgi:ABC-type transport system involved in cytochrome c biogenesis permease subunit
MSGVGRNVCEDSAINLRGGSCDPQYRPIRCLRNQGKSSFPFLTAGIITGAAWANYAGGTYWSWDPKETWLLIVWLDYATFLHTRITRGWHGRGAAILSIAGFLATLFCYLGVNLVLSCLYSYGS